MTYSVTLVCYAFHINWYGRQEMEAVTIAGIAVVVVGGFYSVADFLDDLGIYVDIRRHEKKRLSLFCRSDVPSQGRVKKITGVHV